MRETIEFNEKQLGDAISSYISTKVTGIPFAPYHISKSSWKPVIPLKITVENNPETQPTKPEAKEGRRVFAPKINVSLSRDEIVEAIWMFLPMETMRSFLQLEVCDISVEIPETAEFTLEAIPKGGLCKDYLHALA
jgi:hypothetical protein